MQPEKRPGYWRAYRQRPEVRAAARARALANRLRSRVAKLAYDRAWRHAHREQLSAKARERRAAIRLGLVLGLPAFESPRPGDEGPEESIGPQEIPPGMHACGGCDLLTFRLDVCGFCAAEAVRAAVAA